MSYGYQQRPEGQMHLGFIGAGNMAEAMIRGIIQNQVVRPDRILVSDISAERKEHLSRTFDDRNRGRQRCPGGSIQRDFSWRSSPRRLRPS
jgi:ornithine cyclodeaminase/alanine dehydrogenase-like protein (mu-crystallin family)